MSEKLIYTALIGDYEEVKIPTVMTAGWEYLCITDQWSEIMIKGDEKWKFHDVGIQWDIKIPQRAARALKINPPPDQQSIWIDASFTINCNLDDFWNKYFKPPITVMRHPVRACAYREAQICIRRGLDAENVDKQINRYKKEGFPYNLGLAATGILMRDNSQAAKDFCDLWWQQVVNGSIRDQIGFAYAAWKMPIVNYMDYDYRVRQEFIYTKHYNRR